MYKLEYLLVAQRDMVEIVRYISGKLQKPDAADCLVMELVNVAERVITFSYALPAYQPIRLLKREYRKILVQNFLMFYWVDEEKKLVTVAQQRLNRPRLKVCDSWLFTILSLAHALAYAAYTAKYRLHLRFVRICLSFTYSLYHFFGALLLEISTEPIRSILQKALPV